MGKLRLGFYPYTFARVSVMKGALIQPEMWERLLKMGPSEILRHLQDSEYKAEIDMLGGEKKDIAFLEMALNTCLMRTFQKLKRISDEAVQKVLAAYLERYDMENIKTIVRGKITHSNEDEIRMILLPSINHPKEYFETLLAKDIGEILKSLPFDGATQLPLFEVENALDRYYYTSISDLADGLRGQGNAMQKFIQSEVDILNIKMILRLKTEQFTDVEIRKYLVCPRHAVRQLVTATTIREVAARLHKMGHIGPVSNIADAELSAHIECELDTRLLKKQVILMHQFPLTVNVILGYMFAKEIEVRNLKVLLKGKQLGLDEGYIQKLMVVA